ncbi:MAG: chemotaxis protein [Methylococcales bacterium]
MQARHSKSQFVAVASIAAELSEVMTVAKEISLAAANAKAIAFRAGEKARGFQPITDFINELARETIELVNEINEQAFHLYQMTVEEYRYDHTHKKFKEVELLATGAAFEDSLSTANNNVLKRSQECRRQFQTQITLLFEQLGSVLHPARAARVIAANSRIEASQAGEHLQSLLAVAESVDKAAEVIHSNVQRCRSALSVIQINDKN